MQLLLIETYSTYFNRTRQLDWCPTPTTVGDLAFSVRVYFLAVMSQLQHQQLSLPIHDLVVSHDEDMPVEDQTGIQ
jgi:hypothetical protein